MGKRALVVLAVCGAALLLVPSLAVAAPAGLGALHVQGERAAGPMASSPITVTLVLANRHEQQLKALDSRPHRALTPGQVRARFAPTAGTVSAVERWARAHGLRVLDVSADRSLVRMAAAPAVLGRALGSSFASYLAPGVGRFFSLTRAARLPAALSGRVAAILGLSSLGRVSLPALPRPNGASAAALLRRLTHLLGGSALAALGGLDYPTSYDPQQLLSLYDAPAAQTGAGQQLAIITEGDLAQPKQDLATFEKLYGLPSVTWNQINVGTPSSDTSGDDEWDLDSQYSTAFAPGVTQLDVYVGSSLSDPNILATIDRWVSDDIAQQASFSAGECELLAQASGFLSGLDTVLQRAVAQGQTLFVASGDTGSQCPALVGVNGVPVGLPGVDYPASSPYAIGVGGTTVLGPSSPFGPGPFEIGWYASGGARACLSPPRPFRPRPSSAASCRCCAAACPTSASMPTPTAATTW